jgi:flagellar assembly protein FliH
MSSRATRVPAAQVQPFGWGGPVPCADDAAVSAFDPTPAISVERALDPASVERDAFAKGYAQGERAGAEASAARGEAMLRRLAQTLDELRSLRRDLVRRAEREVVELALAIAMRVVRRELSLDPELLLAMARVALDRLSDVTTANIRLHPDDYTVAMAGRGAPALASHGVQILADPAVGRGGCIVQSEAGAIDVGIAAQIDELTHVLLGDTVHAPAAQRHDDAA